MQIYPQSYIVTNHGYSAFFNNITYVRPKVPTLYSALSSGPLATNSDIYGANTNAFILRKGEIVEIIVNNDDKGRHPFHLHGHDFQTVARSEEEAGSYNGSGTFPKVPMRRDTIMLNPNGNAVLRFKADNPDKYSTKLMCPQLLTLSSTCLALSLSYRVACSLRSCGHHD